MKANPFNPTFGDIPTLFLDKDQQVKKLTTLIQNSTFARSFFITGVRGSGKTAFLTRVSRNFQNDSNCYTIGLLNKKGILTSLARQLYELSNPKTTQIFDSIKSISLGGISISRDTEVPNVDQMLDHLMTHIKEQHKYVVITIDEVTNSKQIRDFAQVFNALKRKSYPIFVIMTGLPDLVLDIQNDEKLTFLLRSEKINMTPLSIADISINYMQVFNCSFEDAGKLAKMTLGYSYAFQLLGYLIFEKLAGHPFNSSLINKITPIYQSFLFENAYQKIFTSLSELDRQYLIAINGHHKLIEVGKIMKKDKVFVSQYRRRAIERRLVHPSGYGYVDYTLPFFNQYINQIQNPDSPYYLGY